MRLVTRPMAARVDADEVVVALEGVHIATVGLPIGELLGKPRVQYERRSAPLALEVDAYAVIRCVGHVDLLKVSGTRSLWRSLPLSYCFIRRKSQAYEDSPRHRPPISARGIWLGRMRG